MTNAKWHAELNSEFDYTPAGGRGLVRLSDPLILNFTRVDPAGVEAFCLEICEDFIWDGASIPRPLWSVVGGPHQPRTALASCIHDDLYAEGGRLGVSRHMADEIFRDILLQCSVSPLKASVMYAGVRVGGWPFYSAGHILSPKCSHILWTDGPRGLSLEDDYILQGF